VDRQEPHPSNYQDCRHAKEEMRKRKLQSVPDYNEKGVLFQPHHPKTIFCGSATMQHMQEQQPQPISVAQACPTTVGKKVPPPLKHNQLVSNQSVLAPNNANSLSVNNMFKVVTTIF
jgi:hypothetical protein